MAQLTIHPGSTLEITVGGPRCPDSGKLLVDGQATLNGTLVLSSFNNFHCDRVSKSAQAMGG
jgi:hypothetical protein